MDAEEIKKIKTLALNEARNRVGASKKDVTIDISDREWEAIQSGAISSTKLVSILQNANKDRVKQLAMPKETQTISPNQINRIHSMANNGYSQAEIADALGISTSTVSKHL